MLLENISLGRTLEIFVDREGYRYRLVSKVEDTNAKRVCVSVIAANGRAFLFHPEDEISLRYQDEDQIWEWTKVKAGLAKLEGSPVHWFEITDKGSSFNRRNAYRVELNEELEIGYYEIPDTEKKSAQAPMIREEYVPGLEETPVGVEMTVGEPTGKIGEDGKEIWARYVSQMDAVPHNEKALVKNISETGLGMYSNCILQEEDNFFLAIPSPYGALKVKATVIRISKMNPVRDKYHFYYGCVYNESDQRLIRYIYDIQRKRIQKRREQKMFEDSFRAMRAKNKKQETESEDE